MIWYVYPEIYFLTRFLLVFYGASYMISSKVATSKRLKSQPIEKGKWVDSILTLERIFNNHHIQKSKKK